MQDKHCVPIAISVTSIVVHVTRNGEKETRGRTTGKGIFISDYSSLIWSRLGNKTNLVDVGDMKVTC